MVLSTVVIAADAEDAKTDAAEDADVDNLIMRVPKSRVMHSMTRHPLLVSIMANYGYPSVSCVIDR